MRWGWATAWPTASCRPSWRGSWTCATASPSTTGSKPGLSYLRGWSLALRTDSGVAGIFSGRSLNRITRHSQNCHKALQWTALQCTALYYTTLHCTAPHCTTLCCTKMHCTALYCSDLHLWCHAQQMFRRILSSATKIFQKMLVLKISDEAFMVNQHSKSITKP